jgi:hypothetical protein
VRLYRETAVMDAARELAAARGLWGRDPEVMPWETVMEYMCVVISAASYLETPDDRG